MRWIEIQPQSEEKTRFEDREDREDDFILEAQKDGLEVKQCNKSKFQAVK